MPRIVAHLIVGAKPEPLLPAMLASIEGAASWLFVNENSGLGEAAPNLPALRASRFAAAERMIVDRTPFDTFARARNRCFALDPAPTLDTWIVFIDGDEVHGEGFARIAQRLDRVPPRVGFIDAYTWHFFASFNWYTSIERRMMFFRWSPQAQWKNDVHEQLAGVPGGRIALPYVYGHYGAAASFSEYARKGAQYSSLGAHGTPLSPQAARVADEGDDYGEVEAFFAEMWPILLRFRAAHPPAARTYIAQQEAMRAKTFAAVDAIVAAHQPPLRRFKNALMRANYEQRWRLRIIEAKRYGLA